MIPVAKPYITQDDEQAVADVVRSGWILQGPKVEEFENKLAHFIGVPDSVATSSCTTALHMALLILGIKPGDEVIVPSFSFIASANCISYAGATPVFVDIDPKTYNMDPKDIEKKITRKTKAIMAVHQIGLPADMKRIMAIAKKHKLLVIEDAACGLGAYIKNQHVGTFGDIAAFSFHPRKAITTAEGGLLVTKNKTWLETARKLRAHGSSISVKERHMSNKVMHESYPIIGYNYRMSDIHAALGLSQLKKLDYMLKRRHELAQNYTQAFSGHEGLLVPYVPPRFTHSFQSYIVRLIDGEKHRENLMQKLLDRGIATRHGVMASHLEKPYKTLYPKLKLPVTELATKETIILPLYPQMTQQEQTYIIDAFLNLLPKRET